MNSITITTGKPQSGSKVPISKPIGIGASTKSTTDKKAYPRDAKTGRYVKRNK